MRATKEAAQKMSEPLHRVADARRAAPAQQTEVAGYTRVSNDLLDRILPTLGAYARGATHAQGSAAARGAANKKGINRLTPDEIQSFAATVADLLGEG